MKEYTEAATKAIEEYMAHKGIKPIVGTHYSVMIDAFGLYTNEERPIPFPPFAESILLISAISKEDGTFLIEESDEIQKYIKRTQVA